MKKFDDFLKTLTEDEVADIINECQEPLAAVQDNRVDKTHLGNQMGTIALFTSLGLLRRYHEWLDE